jgi:hypothetical protein
MALLLPQRNVKFTDCPRMEVTQHKFFESSPTTLEDSRNSFQKSRESISTADLSHARILQEVDWPPQSQISRRRRARLKDLQKKAI